jgi:cytochrome P450
VEIQRTVNATGTVSIAGKHHCVGQHFAGWRITLRLEATLAHVVLDGVLARTIPLALSPTQRARAPTVVTTVMNAEPESGSL